MPELMVFKTGKYLQGNWPKERVQKMVDAYDPENNIEAPAVIGHKLYTATDEDQMAHGWVKSIRMDGSGKVYADIPEFSVEVKRALAEKKLRYISIEIFEFDTIDPAVPPYLKAVALLGRDTPAVPTTKIPAMFGMFADGVMSTVDEKEHVVAFTRKLTAEEMKTLSSEGRHEETQEEHEEENMGEEVQKLQAELAKSNEQLAAFRRENEEMKSAGKKADATAFFAKLRDNGKLAPALFDRAVALDVKLGDEDRKELRALFGELRVTVDLTGTHAADKKTAAGSQAGSASLTAKIRAFQKEKGIATFADAATAFYAEKPELFEDEGGEE